MALPKKNDRDSKSFHTPSTLQRAWSATKEFLRVNLVLMVLLFLVGSWLVISWFVYRVEAPVPGANITSYTEGVWWGIVTFLTVGYGDRYPITGEGRILAGLLMVAGVIAVGVVTAKISSYFLEQTLREGKKIVNTQKLKNHFIVCGWKEDMHELLNHILDFNPGLTSEHVVLVANLVTQSVDEIRAHPRLTNLQVVVGDYFQDSILRHAAPERALKVLILADRTPTASGQPPSATEVDARTVMTAMTLSSIARGTLVAAEILDPKMDQYLKLANVSEIIYTREYSRLLLGNAAGGTGVSNIIFDLLDPKTTTGITTRKIRDEFLNQPYIDFKRKFEAEAKGSVIIGILENTGNNHTIKELALRQAQKTPDMNRLVQNLKSVKELRCNSPVFNPADNYSIPEGSMAIVIENRADVKRDGKNVSEENPILAA